MKRAPRHKVLAGLNKQSHRYTNLRRLTQTITIAVLVAVPMSGLARFDLWRGGHIALREPLDTLSALPVMGMAIAGFYVVTFLLNLFLGRVFCGFGCPVGEASRLADDVDAARKTGRASALARQGLHALLLAGSVTLWWVDIRVLWLGSPLAIAATIGGWLALSAAVVVHGRYWRWSFCKKWCPIGVYYSAVRAKDTFGVRYDVSACDNCDACEKVCPVNLDPKNLDQAWAAPGGLALDDFPAANHCLTCGDCVRACELVLGKSHPEGEQLVALRLSFDAPAEPTPSARPSAEA